MRNAEGAPAETLLVRGDREAFANFVEYERLYGADEGPSAPATNHPIEGEVTFCVRGASGPPCGVPSRLSSNNPLSSTPAVR
jgi:hypothetical protein